jgi:Glycosyl hydrolase catalytic core
MSTLRKFVVIVAAAGLAMWQPAAVHAVAGIQNTVFLDTDANSIAVTTAGSTGTVSYTINGIGGMQWGSGGPLAVANSQVTVALPQLPDGYYLLNVTDDTVSPAASQSISYTVLAPPSPPVNDPFGVSTPGNPGGFSPGSDPPPLSGTGPLMATLGLAWDRLDVTWANVETSPGRYDFSGYDAYMAELAQNGVQPFVILDYTNPLYDANQTPHDAAGYTAFANYAKAVLNHYGSQIKAVEVWNEPNGGWFDSGPCKASPSCYATLLKYTYQAVKSIRPDVTVVGGALFEDSDTLSWLQQVFQAGGMPYLDAVSFHPYGNIPPPAPETQAIERWEAALQGLIKQYNGGSTKPIWVSEIGYGNDDLVQAQFIVRSAAMALAGGAQKFFAYELVGGSTWGLVRQPTSSTSYYTPRPSYAAYGVLTRQLAGATFSASQDQPGYYDKVFSRGGTNNLRVMWSVQGNLNVALSTASPLTVVTMQGGSQTLQPAGGQVALTLTGSPVYVSGPVTSVTGSAGFASDLESGSPQPSWTSTVDSAPYPAGSIANVTGVCCSLPGPEMKVSDGAPLITHSGGSALLYSGKGTNPNGWDHAYMKVFDLSAHPVTVGASSSLSYWIDPEDGSHSYGYASGSNSTCVAVDLIFSDGTNLRDSGAVDQHGIRAHPSFQCSHLALDTWNQVVVNLGAVANGKSIIRVDVGYDQPKVTGGYRGSIDDISILDNA